MPKSRFIRRRLSFLACAVTGFLTLSPVTPSLADDGISDPKAWCGQLTNVIASNNSDQLALMLKVGSRGEINVSNIGVTFAQAQALVTSGAIRATRFLAEKNYADAYAREWYMIVGRLPMFVRCTFIKYDESWQFTDIDFDTKMDNLKLP